MSSRKIFRWIVGDVSDIGLEILEKSVVQAKKILFDLGFEFYICYNSHEDQVKDICRRNYLFSFKQDWNRDFPLPAKIIPKTNDITQSYGEPSGRQGSFWKLCPPRIDINCHEIVCDNDLVIQKCPSEIIDFLNSRKTLVCEENIMNLGKYAKFMKKAYNSGIYGLPPGFDLKKRIMDVWTETGGINPLLSRDEQGILMLVLHKDSIEIPKEKVRFVLNEGETSSAKYEFIYENEFISKSIVEIKYEKCSLNKELIHFLGANRIKKHKYWSVYKNKLL